jgi:hypothetical protein
LPLAAQSWPVVVYNAPGTAGASRAIVKLMPISTVATRKPLGGKTAGLWTIEACVVEGSVKSIPRTLLLAHSTVPFLPNDLAEDVIGRQVASDPNTLISTQGNAFISMVTALVSGLGIAAKSPNTVYAATAASVAQLLINSATKRAPNAQPYFSRLLPELVPVSSNCGTWYLFAPLVRDAAKKGEVWEVRM